MMKQQPGMSPHPGHNPSSKEMQLWQQHLMYRRLQETRQQQQLQQLDQGVRQQNLLSHVAAKQATFNMFPAHLNGIPINDSSSYLLQNGIMGGEPKAPCIADNTFCPQGRGSPTMHGSNGLMFSDDHSQAMRPTIFVPQQADSSVYGTPVSSSRGLLNQYPQFQRMPNNFVDEMSEAIGNQSDRASNSFYRNQSVSERSCFQDGLSVAAQDFQGKNLFVNSPPQCISDCAMSGNFPHVDRPQNSNQGQEFQIRQEQAGWSSNLEQGATQTGPSRGATSLDPTEEKILFGIDVDGNWNASFGRSSSTNSGGNFQGNALEGTDQFVPFPSLHSGSWSALMQEAVEASSSNNGVQEEWSGLSFQKAEQSVQTSPAIIHNGIGKDPTTRYNNDGINFQSASSLKVPLPLVNAANSGAFGSSTLTFPHSTGTACEVNEVLITDTSHEPFELSSSLKQNMHFNQMVNQNQVFEIGSQAENQTRDSEDGIWSGHMQEQSHKIAQSMGMEFKSQNDHSIWTRQQQTLISNNIKTPYVTPTGLKFFSGAYGVTSNGTDNDRTLYAQNGMNVSRDTQPLKSDIGPFEILSMSHADGRNSLFSVANHEVSQHALNEQVDMGKHVSSFVKTTGESVEQYPHERSERQLAQDSSANSAHPSPSISDSQTSPGLSSRKTMGSLWFQSHPMDNLGMNIEPAGCSKELPKLAFQESKNQEQGYEGHSLFGGHGVSTLVKVYSTDMERSIDSPEEASNRSMTSKQKSQNMHAFLQKVNQSMDDGTTAYFGKSDGNTPHETHEEAAMDEAASDFQGFGLKLSTSQPQEAVNHDLPLSTSLLENIRKQHSVAGDKCGMQSDCADSDQSLQHAPEKSQKEISDDRSDLSQQRCKEMSQSGPQGEAAITASGLSYMGRQLQLKKQWQLLQQQQFLGLTGCEVAHQQVNLSFGSQTDVNQHIRHASLLKQAHLFRYVTTSGQSTQTALPTIGGRTLPFRLDSSLDTHGSSSQFSTYDRGHSQQTNIGLYHLKSSAPMVDSGQVPQASAIPGAQQAGFSTMLHNVWANAAVRQSGSHLLPHKLTPNVPESVILSASNRDRSSRILEDDQDKSLSGENSLQGTNTVRGDGTPRTPSVSEEQEQVPKDHTEITHLDVEKGKQGPSVAPSCSNIGLYGQTAIPSKVQQPSYCLLQQIQAMEGLNFDARAEKRLKEDFGSDASQMDLKASFSCSLPLPADVNMLSFASRENEKQHTVKSSQLVGREGSSQDICFPGQRELHNRTQPSVSTTSFAERSEHPLISPQMTQPFATTTSFVERGEYPLISPQMTQAWFERYSNYKNSQILEIQAGQKSAEASLQQYFHAEISKKSDNKTLMEQRIETSQFGSLSQSMSPSTRSGNDSAPLLPLDISGHGRDIVMPSRKRKNATSDLLPWHQAISLGSGRLQSISTAERHWAHAANSLTEEVPVPHARRRLVLTTQLMQQLLPAVPAPLLAAQVTSAYESMTYFLAKSALGDACSLINVTGSESHSYLRDENGISGKLKSAQESRGVFLSKYVDNFLVTSKKLENDLLRLDKRTSVLDIRLELQEVKRFSLANQLAKFHGRSQADVDESSFTSHKPPKKMFPQRDLISFRMPGDVPEGVKCLSL